MRKPKTRNEVELETCHDIRKIRVCALCDGLALEGNMAGYDAGTHVHLSCYFEAHGAEKLLRLPILDLEKVRVRDVPARVMKSILKKFAKEKNA